MIALKRKVRVTLSRLIYGICLLSMYPIIRSMVASNSHESVNMVFLAFRLYLSWAFLILGGILLLNLRKNIYNRIFAVFSIIIGLYWVFVLLYNTA